MGNRLWGGERGNRKADPAYFSWKIRPGFRMLQGR